MKPNNLIKERNHTITLEFYANAHDREPYRQVSYVRGERAEYDSHVINMLLDLPNHEVCMVQHIRLPQNQINDNEWKPILERLCCPGA